MSISRMICISWLGLWPAVSRATVADIELRGRVTQVEGYRSLLSIGKRSIWVDNKRLTPPKANPGELVTVLFTLDELERLPPKAQPGT